MKQVSRNSMLVLGAIALAATTAFAGTTDRILSAIPADAVTVGLIHIDQLRSGSLAGRLFVETNKINLDGEGEKFLRDAGLDPTKDVDTVAFALSPTSTRDDGRPLVVAEGRFDPDRLGAALLKRGAKQQQLNGKIYFVIHEDGTTSEEGAVSFFDKRLVLAGQTEAVRSAITALSSGGTHFRQSSGLAMDMARVPSDASCWMITDVPRMARLHATPKTPTSSPVAADAIAASLKMIQSVTLWAKDDGSDLSFGGTAVSSDRPTRDNLTDMLRGMTAAWRMAAQEKKPELVDIIRKFTVSDDGDAVTIRGSVPAEMLKDFAHQGQLARK